MSSKLILLNVCLFFAFIATSQSKIIPQKTKQIYKYENIVKLLDLRKSPFSSNYRYESTLSVSSIWNDAKESQLLYFELDPMKLYTKESDERKSNDYTLRNSPKLSQLNKQNFYLLLKNNKIEEFYTLTSDRNDVYLLNLKRGLASLFQFQLNDKLSIENDLSGSCNVMYQSKSSTKYQKIKTNCRNWDLKVNFRHENPLGVSSKSSQEIYYDLTQNGILNKLESIETHSRFVRAKPDVGSKIESKTNLKLKTSQEAKQNSEKNIEIFLSKLKNYEKFELEGEIDGQVNKIDGNLKKLVKSEQSNMSKFNIGKLTTSLILTKLLPTARIIKTKEFVQILKSPSTQEIQNQLIDLLAATQTIEAHNAFNKIIIYENEDDVEVIERYLQSLAISTRPNKEIFEDLYERLSTDKIENEGLRDTLIQTLSSIAFKYSKFSPDGHSDKLIEKFKNYMLHKLNKCDDAACKTIYIRGLQNLRDPETINLLLQFALNDQSLTSVAAMKALKNFNCNSFTNKNRLDFEKIFYQLTKKIDSSARTMALDILLDMKPTKDQLTKLLQYLSSNDRAFEVKTYLIQKIRMISEKCSRFAALVKGILMEKPNINNYYIIPQKGLTTVLQRTLSLGPALNESLLSVQEIFKGVLKQGSVDLILNVDNEEFSTFKLGLYTSGLASFVSTVTDDTNDDDDKSEDDLPSTAGMEITVQGIHFRPLVFFNGQSELMGHIWSGTASEPTVAYQATTLQQDHEEYILMENGATIYLNILGAKSIDLNGQIQFSLWNRNAHTEINQNSGIAVVGSMEYRTTFLKMNNKFTTGIEPKVNVVADIDFYTEILLCIQLGNPSTNLWHKTEKSLNIFDTNYSVRSSLNTNYNLPGNTLPLNQKNNEMCNKIAA